MNRTLERAAVLACVAASAAAPRLTGALLTTWVCYRLLPRMERYPYAALDGPRAPGPVIFAGSFNPPHNGHMGVARTLAARYRRVVLVIGSNPAKKYPVSPARRQALLEKALAAEGLQNVEVRCETRYVWRVAVELGCSHLVRAIRTWAADGPPEKVLELQNLVGPVLAGPLLLPRTTSYLQADPATAHLSSTLVRAKANTSADLSDCVPVSIARDVAAAYRDA